MNQKLLQNIVEHIFANFAIIPSDFVNLDRSKSLMSPEYLLLEKLRFELDDKEIYNKVWGCQLSFMKQEVKILLGDCTISNEVKEFAMLVSVKEMPTYGLYLATDNNEYDDSMLVCTVNNKDWMECTTFLQATFLAGMEQIKDIGFGWGKCSNYQEQYQKLLSFIKYYTAILESRDAG